MVFFPFFSGMAREFVATRHTDHVSPTKAQLADVIDYVAIPVPDQPLGCWGVSDGIRRYVRIRCVPFRLEASVEFSSVDLRRFFKFTILLKRF